MKRLSISLVLALSFLTSLGHAKGRIVSLQEEIADTEINIQKLETLRNPEPLLKPYQNYLLALKSSVAQNLPQASGVYYKRLWGLIKAFENKIDHRPEYLGYVVALTQYIEKSRKNWKPGVVSIPFYFYPLPPAYFRVKDSENIYVYVENMENTPWKYIDWVIHYQSGQSLVSLRPNLEHSQSPTKIVSAFFKQEVQILRSLEEQRKLHPETFPRFVETHSIADHEIMEVRYPGDLRELLYESDRFYCDLYSDSKAKFKEIRSLIRQLQALHALGYVHLDLTIQNIFVEERINDEGVAECSLRLADFGLSGKPGTAYDFEIDEKGVTRGSVGFSPPEFHNLNNRFQYWPYAESEFKQGLPFRADIFGLGVVLDLFFNEKTPIWMDHLEEKTFGSEFSSRILREQRWGFNANPFKVTQHLATISWYDNPAFRPSLEQLDQGFEFLEKYGSDYEKAQCIPDLALKEEVIHPYSAELKASLKNAAAGTYFLSYSKASEVDLNFKAKVGDEVYQTRIVKDPKNTCILNRLIQMLKQVGTLKTSL